MIESYYWKEELSRIGAALKRTPNPPRLTERRLAIIERELMVGFFMLRRLIEANKLSVVLRERKIDMSYFDVLEEVEVNRLNHGAIVDLYDLENEKHIAKNVRYLSNQFIHAYTSYILRDETRNWDEVLIVSDFDKSNRIWSVKIAAICDLFLAAANDEINSYRLIWSPCKNDYIVETN